jgi:hypothetical protein
MQYRADEVHRLLHLDDSLGRLLLRRLLSVALREQLGRRRFRGRLLSRVGR